MPVLVDDETLVEPAGDGGDPDLREDIRIAMQALTEDQQMVITLRFLLDRSITETAVNMSRSEDAVKLLQRRALAALQRQLGASYREGGA